MQRRLFNFSPHAAVWLACLAAWPMGQASAATIAIDSFTAPGASAVQAIRRLDPGPKLLVKQSDPDVLGQQRDVLFEVAASPQNSSYTGTIGNGVFVYAAGVRIGTKATLQYDGIDADDSDTDPNLVDALNIGAGSAFDLTGGDGDGKFVFSFLSSQGGPSSTSFGFEIRAVSTGGSAVFASTIGDSASPFDHEVEFSAFTPTGSFSFTQLRSLTIVFNTESLPGVDFELANIEVITVPEPGTIVLLGVGGLLVGWQGLRRRKAVRHS